MSVRLKAFISLYFCTAFCLKSLIRATFPPYQLRVTKNHTRITSWWNVHWPALVTADSRILIQVKNLYSEIQIYLQSIPVHSANRVKTRIQ
jgi:hypothetical protein